MTKSRSVAIVDTRVLDTFQGAEMIRELEDKAISFIFVSENPDTHPDSKSNPDSALDDHPNSALIRKNSKTQTSKEFWKAVFEYVTNQTHTDLVAVVGHYNHWQIFNEANKHAVPFQFTYDETISRMVWL